MKTNIHHDKTTVKEFIDFVLKDLTPKPTCECGSYNIELLEEMQEYFIAEYANNLTPLIAALFGVCLGETIVRNVNGAEWINLDSKNLAEMTVVIRPPNDRTSELLRIRPVLNIVRFSQDPRHTMTAVFKLALIMSQMANDEMKTFIDSKSNKI